MAKQIELTPACPDWSSLFPKPAELDRRLRIACPCVGIHGCGHALQSMATGADSVLVYDLQAGYKNYLLDHLQAGGMRLQDIVLNLGKKAGDLMKVPLSKLGWADFLVSGPPCPPWAGQGKRKGLEDKHKRGHVFMRVLQWALFLIKCGGLLACVLENVLGMTHAVQGREPFMDRILRCMRLLAPEFDWAVSVLHARDYLLPQTRVRVFLRGMRKAITNNVPACLPALGTRHIREALAKLPCTPRSALTPPQQKNLTDFESSIVKCVDDGKLQLEDVVVVAVDRAEGGVYNPTMTTNSFPTLTTHNQYLMILSVADVVAGTPDEQREFFRKPAPTERMTAQGFPADAVLRVPSNLHVFAPGNAYPPPLIRAALQPMIEALANSTLVLRDWPPQSMLSTEEPEEAQKLIRMMRGPGKKMKKAKPQNAKAKARATKKKRALSDSE